MATPKKRRGDRFDATLLRDIDALHWFMPYLYPNRADNEAFIKEDEVEVLIQVLGKPKARIMMPIEADAAEMQRLAEADASVQKALEGKTVVKVIAVPKRVVNFVVR